MAARAPTRAAVSGGDSGGGGVVNVLGFWMIVSFAGVVAIAAEAVESVLLLCFTFSPSSFVFFSFSLPFH